MDLMQAFGVESISPRPSFKMSKTKKEYVLPDTELRPLTEEIIAYFAKRKIGVGTLEAFGVAADEYGNIVFPFMRDRRFTYVKYRKPRKPQQGEPKEWQSKNTCPILFGMDMCSFSKPLIITEGQVDCLSLYECGISNVVSVPCGSENLEWFEPCWDWLERFSKIIIFGDNDEPGKKMVSSLSKRLDESRCEVVEEYPVGPNGEECKDANEILYFLGKDALTQTLDSAKPVPLRGIIQLADVIPKDPTTIPRIKTMIPKLDESLGGLLEGS